MVLVPIFFSSLKLVCVLLASSWGRDVIGLGVRQNLGDLMLAGTAVSLASPVSPQK